MRFKRRVVEIASIGAERGCEVATPVDRLGREGVGDVRSTIAYAIIWPDNSTYDWY